MPRWPHPAGPEGRSDELREEKKKEIETDTTSLKKREEQKIVQRDQDLCTRYELKKPHDFLFIELFLRVYYDPRPPL